MSVYDQWGSPAWAYQGKAKAREDLGIVGVGANGGKFIGPWTGDIFYVSNSGTAAGDGSKDNPLLTITAALGLVTAGANDVIVVLDYGSLSRAAETFPIAITSSHNNLTIMGVPYGNIGSNAIYPGTDVSTFTLIDAYQINLVDLNIGAGGATGYAISYPSGTCWRNSIVGCHFGTSGTTGWGIYIASDPPQLLVEGCDFHSGLAVGGIYVANCTRGDFIGNSFHVNSGDWGIQFSTSQADFGKIMYNTFMVPDVTNGEAIYCAGALAGGIELIAHNTAVISGTNLGSTMSFDNEPYWWGGSGAMGVGYGPNSPDPLAPYYQYMPVGGGKMIFVNGGSDGPTDNVRDGSTPQMAKQTVTAALALVTDGGEDVIFILNYGSNGRAAETWPININKGRFSIIGQGRGSTKWPLVTATGTNKSAFNFGASGGRVTIKNLNIGGTAAGTGAGILVESGIYPWGVHIENCQFGYEGSAGTNGIRVESGGDAPYLSVTDCIFGSALLGTQVLLTGNATRGWIGKQNHGNFFEPATNQLCVDVAGAVQVKVFDNYFVELSDNADGEAITFSGSSAQCSAMGNKATSNDLAVPTNNAYNDSSSGTNSWGLNYHVAATGTDMGHLPA
jgi:hypothetical protein